MEQAWFNLVSIVVLNKGCPHPLVVCITVVIPATMFLGNFYFGINPLVDVKICPRIIPGVVFNHHRCLVVGCEPKLVGLFFMHLGYRLAEV